MKRSVAFIAAAIILCAAGAGAYADFEPETDYSLIMIEAAVSGDTQSGIEAEKQRDEKIDSLGLDEAKISYADMLLLAKIIHSEAGSEWLPEDWRMAVGEVLLNRVESPEFPNTIEECIYQPGQYGGVGSCWFESLVPNVNSVTAAKRLLSGERVLNEPSVVFQSNGPQGSGVFLELKDEYFGSTYLCYSQYPELYEG